ncbi:MAG: hypothetical protein CMJ20_05550 [Phycisphaeraceae bacterium]|nr:hypothetical protein [Phycisphaeraceae bacterium]
MIKNIKHYILRDHQSDIVLSDMYELPTRESHPEIFDDNIAFVCLLPHPGDGKLYCGLTAYNTDVLYRFDTESKEFESLHYPEIAEPFEVKVHRSLELASDGTVYGATACLHSVSQRKQAPGGALFKIKPGGDHAEKFAIPVEYDYIQTISLDDERQLIYGQTYPVFNAFSYDLKTGKTKNFGYVGSITHISAIDDSGCFWGTWNENEHFLYKYDPDADEMTWFHHSVPNAKADSSRMYAGAGPVDTMINGGDGYLYIGTCGGTLCRLDPKTAEVTYLAKPAPTARLPGLIVWKDSLLLGCMGDDNDSVLFAYDRDNGSVHHLGPLVDTETGLTLFRVHDLRLMGENTVYVAETDVPDRSGYLWECEIGF